MLDIALHAFTTLFVVIDPLGLVPLLLALTIGVPAAARRRMALRGTLIATVILLGFALLGEPLLELLGIGLPAFRTAGGVMLLLIALEMVFQRRIDGVWKTIRGTRTLTDHGLATAVVTAPAGTRVRAVTKPDGYLGGSTSRSVKLSS